MRILFLLFLLIPSAVSAFNELPAKNQWLSDFLEEGLKSAYAKWEFKDKSDLNREEIKSWYYDFSTQELFFEYELNHSMHWDVLTKDGTVDPPKIGRSYSSSKITQWTNFKGMGTYKELYSRTLPNWLYFKELDTLVLLINKLDSDPAINQILWSDEEKQISKMKGSDKLAERKIWMQFEYDGKDRIIGVSTEYLLKQSAPRKFDDRVEYHVYLDNRSGDRVILTPVTSEKEGMFMDGVEFKMDNNTAIFYNNSLNERLHKFSPDIFRDPSKVFRSFLLILQEVSGKKLSRLESK